MNTIYRIIILLNCFSFLSLEFNITACNLWKDESPTDSITYKTIQHCYELYTNGVNSQSVGDIPAAKQYYDQYLLLNCEHELLNSVLIDLLARYIGIAVAVDDWKQVCSLGAKLNDIPLEIQEGYQNTAWMYLMYVYSLNMQNKCDHIEEIIQTGLYYADRTYSPTDKEYYELRFQHIISKLNISDYYSATQILNKIKRINDSTGLHLVDDEIIRIEHHILKYKNANPFKNKKEFVTKFSNDIVEASVWAASLGYSETEELWHSLIDLGQNFLSNTYFDVNSVDEEGIWTYFMAWYGVLINGLGRGLDVPDREEQAYNYVLTCKNFLDWHSDKSSKLEIKWHQIIERLNDNEIAIEFIPLTNEVILLSHKLNKPQIVEIDSQIIDRILEYKYDDPWVINNFYKRGSPLTDLISILIPYIKDYKRVYISGSNRFAQFNYGAIPYNDNTLDDLFEIIPMISTADILEYKSKKLNSHFKKVDMYGGMDYDRSSKKHVSSIQKNYWTYLSEAPDELRKGFSFLPFTQREIDNIASLCDKYNIKYQKNYGQDANESRLKDTKYYNSTILHIATHSFLLPSYSFEDLSHLSKKKKISKLGTVLSNTGLLFSGCNESLKTGTANGDDGILTAEEISQLDLTNIDLVVLSSCSSGLGDINSVNGVVYGLTNAFRTAGCGQIMISLWDVPDYTTSLFMQAFYDNLLKGYNPRESLKFAQTRIISLGYGDPYYWASFILLD